MSLIVLVVAVSRNGVIGRDGALPWRLPSDLRRFKEITMGKPIIMGRKTWEALPRKPLPGRTNIVVSRQPGYLAPGAIVAGTVNEALAVARSAKPAEIAVIGGGDIYRQILPFADRIYLSEVDAEAEGDTHFPELDDKDWQEVRRDPRLQEAGDEAGYVYRVLERRR
jgi:dihydrofolate reductase